MKIIISIFCVLLVSSCNSEGGKQSQDLQSMTVSGQTLGSQKVKDVKSVAHHIEKSSTGSISDLKEKLAASPRHQEWVEINNKGKIIYAFVVYPENKQKTAAVLLIHENKGLNDWARSMADQIAAEGYIVVAPDLLSSFDDKRKKTSDFASADEATQALYALDKGSLASDIEAVSQYVQKIDSYNGNLVSAGFCWGGSQSFNFAAQSNDLKAALVFYGTAPEDDSLYADIDAPVYAFYGENDERVNATIKDTKNNMNKNKKQFQYEIYPGAGHAFMRNAQGDDADEATIAARNNAFEKMKSILNPLKN